MTTHPDTTAARPGDISNFDQADTVLVSLAGKFEEAGRLTFDILGARASQDRFQALETILPV